MMQVHLVRGIVSFVLLDHKSDLMILHSAYYMRVRFMEIINFILK